MKNKSDINPVKEVLSCLRDLGFSEDTTTYEHPGYIQINLREGVQLAIGNSNDTWMIDIHLNGAFTPDSVIDLNIPRDSREWAIIADAVQNAIAEQL